MKNSKKHGFWKLAKEHHVCVTVPKVEWSLISVQMCSWVFQFISQGPSKWLHTSYMIYKMFNDKICLLKKIYVHVEVLQIYTQGTHADLKLLHLGGQLACLLPLCFTFWCSNTLTWKIQYYRKFLMYCLCSQRWWKCNHGPEIMPPDHLYDTPHQWNEWFKLLGMQSSRGYPLRVEMCRLKFHMYLSEDMF